MGHFKDSGFTISETTMYKIRINGLLSKYSFTNEHSARLIYSAIITMAEKKDPPRTEFGKVVDSAILIHVDELSSKVTELMKWTRFIQ